MVLSFVTPTRHLRYEVGHLVGYVAS